MAGRAVPAVKHLGTKHSTCRYPWTMEKSMERFMEKTIWKDHCYCCLTRMVSTRPSQMQFRLNKAPEARQMARMLDRQTDRQCLLLVSPCTPTAQGQVRIMGPILPGSNEVAPVTRIITLELAISREFPPEWGCREPFHIPPQMEKLCQVSTSGAL